MCFVFSHEYVHSFTQSRLLCVSVSDVEQPRKNAAAATGGAALLGGSGLGLQQYDQYIATLRRERSLVRDGGIATSAADQRKPPSTTARPRQRQPLNVSTANTSQINGTGNGRLEDVKPTRGIGKPPPADDLPLLLKSAGEEDSPAASTSDMTSPRVATFAPRRRRRRKLDAARSPTEVDITRGTADVELEAVKRSPKQRRRRRRNDRRRDGGGDGPSGTDAARERSDGLYTPVNDDSLQNAASASNDSEPWRSEQNQKMADLHRGGCRVPERNFADRDRSERRDTVIPQVPERVDYQLSGRSSNQSEATHFDKTVVDRRNEDGVFLLAAVDATDCDGQRVEQFDDDHEEMKRQDRVDQDNRTTKTIDSPTVDRYRSVGSEPEVSSSTSVSAGCPQSGRHVTEACVCGDVQLCHCTVRRQTSSQPGDEWTTPSRQRRQCQSQPSLYHATPVNHASATFDKSPSHDEVRRSQHLEAIARPTTAACYAAENENARDNRRSQPSDRLVPRNFAAANISTLPERGIRSTNDVQYLSADLCQRYPGPTGSASNGPQGAPLRSSSDKGGLHRDNGGLDRRTVQVFYDGWRWRRQSGGRRGGKASKCSLRIELVLTRRQTQHQESTFLFARGKAVELPAVEQRNHISDGDSDVPNSSPSRLCATYVMMNGTDDDDDDVRGDEGRDSDSEEKCVTLKISTRLTDSDCDNSHRPVSPAVHDAAGAGTADDIQPRDVTSGDTDEVSQSVVVYEFAEVTSIFRNFAVDLLPTTTDRSLSPRQVPLEAARRRAGGALIPRARPVANHCGAVIPVGSRSSIVVPLPLMTWTWNDFAGSRRRDTSDDVVRIPYIAQCATIDVELPIDHFTLTTVVS